MSPLHYTPQTYNNKFKMAEGRQFENSFISISQSELSDFEQIWYADANFHFEDGYLTKRNSKFFKFKMADGRHIKNRFFWLYLGSLLDNRREIWKGDEESHANTGHMTKTAIFQNSRWRTAAILKTI